MSLLLELCDAAALLAAKGQNGASALHATANAERNGPAVAELLLGAGADLEFLDNDGDTAVQWVSTAGGCPRA